MESNSWAQQGTMHRVLHLRNRIGTVDRRGLTLVEGLCLLAIAAILLAGIYAIIPKFGGLERRMPVAVAMTQIATFKTGLTFFRAHNGFYPTGTNGLQDLVRQPAGTTNWHGPYVDGIPKDPWGREYVYECPGKHSELGYPYDLRSEE